MDVYQLQIADLWSNHAEKHWPTKFIAFLPLKLAENKIAVKTSLVRRGSLGSTSSVPIFGHLRRFGA